jgi:16S rRNA (guanine966-N2)-methyltransferase
VGTRTGSRGAGVGQGPGRRRVGLSNSVRIIGGEWRGRRIRFPDVEGLRPTPDRLRETLFNWLQGGLASVRALDLFAGSGALGLEAHSRGAAEVVLVESDARAATAIEGTMRTLAATRAHLVRVDAFRFLKGPASAYGLVFLDPPFAQGRWSELCTLLETGGWLTPRAMIYVEMPKDRDRPAFPATWYLSREARAGDVVGLLMRRSSESLNADLDTDASQ